MLVALAGIIFVATIAALYFRPFGARDWHVALAGACLAWLVSPLSFDDALREVRGTWNIEAFFFGLMLLQAGADAAGLYARVGALLTRRADGSSRVSALLATGTVTTAVLSNDATALILTPAVFAAEASGEALTLASAFTVTFTADCASLLLPMSNPVGLLFYERFGLTWGGWMRDIFPAAATAVVVLGILLVWQARRLPEAAASSASRRPFDRSEAAAMLVFGVLAIAYVVAGIAGLKLGIVTLSGGLVLAALLRSLGADTTAYRRTFSPGLLVFVAALVLLVECVSAAGVLARLSDVMDALAGQPLVLAILGSAVAGTILSNVMNNWPAAVLLTAVIAAVPGNQQPLVAGALIGCTIGGNLTVVGSLSTVFWLSLSSRAGLRISALHYLQNAWLPTLAGLAAASLVASASLLR